MYTERRKAIEEIEEMTETIRLNPLYAHAYRMRGLTYYHLGQYNQAIQDYTEVIAINPHDANAYGMRAGAYYELGQWNRAEENQAKAEAMYKKGGR